MRKRWLVFALLVGALAFTAAGCGDDDDGGGAEGSEDVTGEISTMAIWAGEEQESFEAVIAGFNELYPNVTVKYNSGGDNLVPLLSTAVEGGNRPISRRSASRASWRTSPSRARSSRSTTA